MYVHVQQAVQSKTGSRSVKQRHSSTIDNLEIQTGMKEGRIGKRKWGSGEKEKEKTCEVKSNKSNEGR